MDVEALDLEQTQVTAPKHSICAKAATLSKERDWNHTQWFILRSFKGGAVQTMLGSMTWRDMASLVPK
jgi:hypothetical protein